MQTKCTWCHIELAQLLEMSNGEINLRLLPKRRGCERCVTGNRDDLRWGTAISLCRLQLRLLMRI